VLGAEERQRITLPDGRLIDVELWFGPSKVVLADEFPEHDARSPKATGCSSAVFYLDVDDVDVVWERALAQGAAVLRPLADWFTGSAWSTAHWQRSGDRRPTPRSRPVA
jgi:PhnB protein